MATKKRAGKQTSKSSAGPASAGPDALREVVRVVGAYVGLGAFAVTFAVKMLHGAEPLDTVVRSIAAFAAAWLAVRLGVAVVRSYLALGT